VLTVTRRRGSQMEEAWDCLGLREKMFRKERRAPAIVKCQDSRSASGLGKQFYWWLYQDVGPVKKISSSRRKARRQSDVQEVRPGLNRGKFGREGENKPGTRG